MPRLRSPVISGGRIRFKWEEREKFLIGSLDSKSDITEIGNSQNVEHDSCHVLAAMRIQVRF